MDKKILVIGTGSIASRHINNINKIAPKAKIYIYSKSKKYNWLDQKLKKKINYIKLNKLDIKNIGISHLIIASNTSTHSFYLFKFYNKVKNIYCEKPIPIDSYYYLLLKLLKNKRINNKIKIGFQWRFNPTVNYIKKFILKNSKKIYQLDISIGQHLSQWRKNKNNKNFNFSGRRKFSGVHWELCHELDLLNYFFDDDTLIKSFLTISNKLNFKIVDNANTIIKLKRKKILCNLTQNMLSPKLYHLVRLYLVDRTIEFDLIKNNFYELNSNNTKVKKIQKSFSMNDMFLSYMKNFLYIKKNSKFATLKDGIKVSKQIAEMEKS